MARAVTFMIASRRVWIVGAGTVATCDRRRASTSAPDWPPSTFCLPRHVSLNPRETIGADGHVCYLSKSRAAAQSTRNRGLACAKLANARESRSRCLTKSVSYKVQKRAAVDHLGGDAAQMKEHPHRLAPEKPSRGPPHLSAFGVERRQLPTKAIGLRLRAVLAAHRRDALCKRFLPGGRVATTEPPAPLLAEHQTGFVSNGILKVNLVALLSEVTSMVPP